MKGEYLAQFFSIWKDSSFAMYILSSTFVANALNSKKKKQRY